MACDRVFLVLYLISFEARKGKGENKVFFLFKALDHHFRLPSTLKTQMQQNSATPLRSLFSFIGATESRTDRLMNRLRPTRPPLHNQPDGGNYSQMFGNVQGNRVVHSTKSFETQGIILPVHLVRSSLTAVKCSDHLIEICGKADCSVACEIEIGCAEAWKSKTFKTETRIEPGIAQEFTIKVPAFTSLGAKTAEIKIYKVDGEARAEKLNNGEKFANPFYVSQEFMTLSLSLRESGLYELKVEDQFIKMRNKNFSLLEIYGKPTTSAKSTASSPTSYCSDGLSNRECIICMSEVKDTIVLPCRHMCLCFECANTIRNRSDKCPLCRQGKENQKCKYIFILIFRFRIQSFAKYKKFVTTHQFPFPSNYVFWPFVREELVSLIKWNPPWDYKSLKRNVVRFEAIKDEHHILFSRCSCKKKKFEIFLIILL